MVVCILGYIDLAMVCVIPRAQMLNVRKGMIQMMSHLILSQTLVA